MESALKEAEWTARQYEDLVRDYSAEAASVPIPYEAVKAPNAPAETPKADSLPPPPVG